LQEVVEMIIRADADFKSNFIKLPGSTMAKVLRIKRRKGHHCGVLPPCQHRQTRETGERAGRTSWVMITNLLVKSAKRA
jgi:hypothetical protein